MKILYIGILLSFQIFLNLSLNVYAASFVEKESEAVIKPLKITSFPIIDGSLDEDVWKKASVISKEFITFNPTKGNVFPQKTDIMITYNNENIYFAFICNDTEPQKIKTSVTQRDNMFSDDWVAILFDTMGNGQGAYEFFVNPNGIQGDAYNTVNNGEDSAPDWIWKSAAKRTKDGYQIEMCIPLKSISYKSGKKVSMKILFARNTSHLGLKGSWPEIKDGKSLLNSQATILFDDLNGNSNAEILPSITYGSNKELRSPGKWENPYKSYSEGIGIKYSPTSSVNIETTINPDFSQVESDAFQVDVNRRYPVFYSEKRPFFIETSSFFNISGTGGGLMSSSMYTRKIIDPAWSSKIMGSDDKYSYGILMAEDSWKDPDEKLSFERNLYSAARGKYSLSGDNYIGGILETHEYTGGYNRTTGFDGIYRYGKNCLSGFFLQSFSGKNEDDKNADGSNSGEAASIVLNRDTRKFSFYYSMEHYSRDFRMDTAFYDRTGVNKHYIYLSPIFYPDLKKISWLKKINFCVDGSNLYDMKTRMNDVYLGTSINMNFTKQGYASLTRSFGKEAWAGKSFYKNNYRFSSGIQAAKWLWLDSYVYTGKGIYYDTDNPFLGNCFNYSFNINLQPDTKFSQKLGFNHAELKRPSGTSYAYYVNILNTRTTYQFNKYFFLRLTLQYNSYNKTLLQDYLASCTFIPGTVIHLGYGELSQRCEWINNEWVKSDTELRPLKRSLFFKTSYLYRF